MVVMVSECFGRLRPLDWDVRGPAPPSGRVLPARSGLPFLHPWPSDAQVLSLRRSSTCGRFCGRGPSRGAGAEGDAWVCPAHPWLQVDGAVVAGWPPASAAARHAEGPGSGPEGLGRGRGWEVEGELLWALAGGGGGWGPTAVVGERLGSSTLGKAHGGRDEQRLLPLLPPPPPAWTTPPKAWLPAGNPQCWGQRRGLYQCVPSAPLPVLLFQPLLQASDRPGVQPAVPLWSLNQRLQGPPAGEPLLCSPPSPRRVTPPVISKGSVSQP